MKENIKLNIDNVNIPYSLLENIEPYIKEADKLLYSKKGPGNEFLGWLEPKNIVDNNKLEKILNEVKRLYEISEVMVVIGIGGSYLGAKAVIEVLSSFFNSKKQVVFAGFQLSGVYHRRLLKELENKEVCLTVISKSGTTLETSIIFKIFKKFMEKKYGEKEANKRIIAITDEKTGVLRSIVNKKGYSSFEIPKDIGGRYSVLSAVGLFPIAYAGFDIREILKGAQDICDFIKSNKSIENNIAWRYAGVRNVLYKQGKIIEILALFEPSLIYFGEWWKQLFGESEGKNNMGIFPSILNFSTDLHSMGQYIQEGRRDIFETFLIIEKYKEFLKIPKNNNGDDSLEYLNELTLEKVNHQIYLGVSQAHLQGGIPNLSICIPEISPYYVGQIIYFFEISCALSGYLLGINPFDQPGVQVYKKIVVQRLKNLKKV